MSRDVVSFSTIEINSSQGSKELESVISMTIRETKSKKVVKTMTRRRRAIGRQRGIPDYELELEVVFLRTRPEVDWEKLLDDDEEFLLTWEEDGAGLRRTAIDCEVEEVNIPYREDGETRGTVKITALDVRRE
jgi:hypothetical protein